MLSAIVSTVVFFMAAWILNRYLDDQGIPKGMLRGLTVLILASLMSWGAGWAVEWTQDNANGSNSAVPVSGGVSQILRAANQGQQ